MSTLAGLTATAAVGAIVVTGSQLNAEPAPPQEAAAAVVTGCAIRFTANGPAIHQNSTHTCTGASAVSVASNGDLVITSPGRGAVISVTAEEDETLARKGVLAGASGGISRTVVRFYSTRTGAFVRADSPALQDPYANLWMTWVNQS